VEAIYWKRVPIHSIRGESAEISHALGKLIEAGRARHGVHLVGYQTHQGTKVGSEVLVRLLLESARQPIEGELHNNDKVMFQHYVAEILQQLDKATDVTTETMLQLEWVYLPLLEHSERPAKVITRELANNPGLFVQIICAVYKASVDSGVVAEVPADMQQAQNVATQAYRLLRLWNVIPGTAADGTIEGAKLEAWVKEARKLAHTAGRGEVADQKIGELLSASPIGADGIWPALPVRELIETVRSGQLETGFLIGRHNRRGVTSRLPRDGGAQERELAKTYREWSKATTFDWLRTSAVLENLAKSYERDARSHDDDVERLDWH
jgi:hypothetical protein